MITYGLQYKLYCMSNKSVVQIESPGRRAAAYWFVDGLPEILFGLFSLLLAGFGMAAGNLRFQARYSGVLAVCLFFSLTGYAIWFLHRPVLNFVKARITYPRTGYAHPPEDFPSKNHPHAKTLTLGTFRPSDENVSSFASHTVPLIFGGAAVMGFLRPTSWGLPLVMVGIAAGIYLLHRNGVRPYSLLSVLPLVLAGIIAAAWNPAIPWRLMAPLILSGFWLLGIGPWTLVRYLRYHPKQGAGQEGGL